MVRIPPLLVMLVLAAYTGKGNAQPDNPVAEKPNILIILADDLGYGDVQCYNRERGKIPTPNIDRLAAEGMRFTDAHSSSSVCTPSRYSLLTGRYPWRTRLQSGVLKPFEEPLIPADRLTIAGLAKEHGYRTACIGKWHLGWHWNIPDLTKKLPRLLQKSRLDEEQERMPDPETLALWNEIFSKPIAGGPTSCGFDFYFGMDAPNYPPYCFIENDRPSGMPTAYLTAADLKKNQASFQGPALPDWKLEAVLPVLGDRAAAFIRETARTGQPFLLYLPMTSPHTPLAVNAEWKGRSGLNAYADFVMETDAFVGRILEALKKSGAAGNTLVLFTSDNGCAPYIGVQELEAKGHFPSGNLRGYKASAWEGGHRMPFIVRWPGVVKPGTVCPQLIQQGDLLATLAQLFRARLPENAGEDSVSILPLLEGKSEPVRSNSVSCSVHGVPSLRQGDWKIIFGNPSHAASALKEPLPPSLYDLSTDPGETTDLAEKYPDRVAEMKAVLEKIIADGRSTPGPSQKNDMQPDS